MRIAISNCTVEHNQFEKRPTVFQSELRIHKLAQALEKASLNTAIILADGPLPVQHTEVLKSKPMIGREIEPFNNQGLTIVG